MRALAEAPQMLMSYAGLQYEYLMSWEYFDDEWENVKPTIPFKQLPILVVDDDEATRMILRKMLVKDGWHVAESEHGLSLIHI